MIEKYNLKLPQAVFGGEDALENIKKILIDNNVTRLAIITDKGIEKAGLLALPLKKVEEAGVSYEIFDNLPAEPSYLEAQALVDACKACNVDFIMAVGGGSVMDTAKLTSILMTDEHDIKELLDMPEITKKYVKTLMIPTTAGTGSEATPNAIVAVPEKQLKIGVVNAEMMADYVILDAVMIKNLPSKIAAATGVDALAHAIECWTSKKANPFSDIFALRALELIMNNIEDACDDPTNIVAKRNMQIASFFAGIAITASGTTAVHALSYPLGGKYHIAHGVSNAILLVPVMKFNESGCRQRLAQAYDYCIKGNAQTDEEKSAAIIERLDAIVKHLKIPVTLSEFGVSLDDLEDLVRSGLEVKRLLVNNMREVTEKDAREIYLQVL